MIAYLKGKITHKSPTYIYLDVNGVAYHVNISLNTYGQIENMNEGKIYTYVHTNDDGQSMYGFIDEIEKEIFGLLLSVSGVGPNTARMILSYMTADEVKSAILSENVKALNQVKGVGPKTAKRMILDLKDKVFKLQGSEDIAIVSGTDDTIKEEALSALVSLGFPKVSIEKTITQTLKSNPEINQVEELIKSVLKQMR